MRTSTKFIQLVCVLLGVAFTWATFVLSNQVLFGGLLMGSFMFMAAALLGADHPESPSPVVQSAGHHRGFAGHLLRGLRLCSVCA